MAAVVDWVRLYCYMAHGGLDLYTGSQHFPRNGQERCLLETYQGYCSAYAIDDHIVVDDNPFCVPALVGVFP